MSRTTDALAIRSEQIARVDEGQPEYSWEKRLLKYQADFQLAMPAGDANQLIRDALNCFRTTPRLLECEQATILGGLMTCAQLNLRPGVNGLGQAWLVPFRNGKASRRLEREVYEAQLIIGYQGMAELGHRSQLFSRPPTGRQVRENEPFQMSYEPPELIHKPAPFDIDPGAPVGYYVACNALNGGLMFEAMGEKEAEAYRQKMLSRPGSRGSAWDTDPVPMKIKTCMRRLFKWLPKSPSMQTAEAVDGTVRVDPSPDRAPEDVSQVADEVDGDVVDDENPLHYEEEKA